MMQSALTILADSRINSFLYIYTIPKGGLSDHILHASCGRNSCGVQGFGMKSKSLVIPTVLGAGPYKRQNLIFKSMHLNVQ